LIPAVFSGDIADMTRVRCLVISTILLLSSLAGSAVARERACYGVWVTRVEAQRQSAAKRTRRARDFSASEVLDLRFLVLVPNDDPSPLYLKLFTPKGHLYQKLRVSLEPVSVEANRQRRRSRYRWVSASLPVAGTTIATSSLYGRWRAEAYVEGENAPCTQPRSFVIHQ
jgi:hypothetical protein